MVASPSGAQGIDRTEMSVMRWICRLALRERMDVKSSENCWDYDCALYGVEHRDEVSWINYCTVMEGAGIRQKTD